MGMKVESLLLSSYVFFMAFGYGRNGGGSCGLVNQLRSGVCGLKLG